MTGLIDATASPPLPTTPDLEPARSAALDPEAPERHRIDPATRGLSLIRPATYYLLSRVAVFATALVATSFIPKLHIFQTLGTAFDGRWYLKIAQHGYPDHLYQEGQGSRWAFFPGFPASVRALSEVTRLSLPHAALLAAFVFGLTSSLAIWLAAREIFGARLADRAVLLFVFCPTAYVLSLAYTEGLFLTAAAGCLFALSRRYWITAALCACAAGLTRNTGIAVILAVLVVALPAAWRGRAWRPAVAAVIAPLGLVTFMAYGWAMVGTPVAFLSAERFWQGQHFVWFVAPVGALFAALHGGATFLTNAMAGLALIVGLVGIWLFDRLSRTLRTVGGALATVPASWWAYTIGALLIAYSAYFTEQHSALHDGRLSALRRVCVETAPLNGKRSRWCAGMPAGRSPHRRAHFRGAPVGPFTPPLTQSGARQSRKAPIRGQRTTGALPEGYFGSGRNGVAL